MKKVLLILLPPLLGACATLESLNTPENREAAVVIAINTIESLNEGGFDPVKLEDENVRGMALFACNALAAYLPTLVDDPDKRAEYIALGYDACSVLGVALAPAAPVEAPAPETKPEVTT